jgi:LAS superfamily LD-carboxypeptidase LdcB
MHDRIQAFLADMCNWVDSFYLALKNTSQCTPEEAWHLVALCVKKVFEELPLPRAKVANAAGLVSLNAKLTAFL